MDETMLQTILQRCNRKTLLCYVIAVAICAHVIPLFLIKDLDMELYSPKKNLWINPKILQQEAIARKEIKKKNEILAAVFKEQTLNEIKPEIVYHEHQATPMKPEFEAAAFNNITAETSFKEERYSPDDLLGDSLSIPSFDPLFLSEVGKREVQIPQTNKNSRPFDDSSGMVASSENFNLNVEYAPLQNGSGYIFKLELVPKPDVRFRRIAQNVFFLIDRSHSIRFQRFELTKQAVSQALDLLHEGDTFNVLFFDDKIEKLSHVNLEWNASTVAQAKHYMDQQKYGGIWATTDLYSSLGQIVPQAVGENEVNTAILLSDGDTFLNQEKQRATIAKWTSQNEGKVSLYSVASGKGNNLALLDLLTFFNRGTLHYVGRDHDLERGLLQLMMSIRTPIGKDIQVTAVSTASDVHIAIFPQNQFLADLYENTPYVVYGMINKLKDFHIFFQGKYYEKLLDIKQQVSFEKGRKSPPAQLAKSIAQQQAYAMYKDFLMHGNLTDLVRIKQLLLPYQLPVAFQ